MKYIVRVYSRFEDKLLNAHIAYTADEVLMRVLQASNDGYFVRVYGGVSEERKPEPFVSLAEMVRKPDVKDWS